MGHLLRTVVEASGCLLNIRFPYLFVSVSHEKGKHFQQCPHAMIPSQPQPAGITKHTWHNWCGLESLRTRAWDLPT